MVFMRYHRSPVLKLHVYLFLIFIFWYFHIILLPSSDIFLGRVQSPRGLVSSDFEN